VRRVGILLAASRTDIGSPDYAAVDAFKQGLAGLGWAEGRNARFEERWANNDAELAVQATELARLACDAIFVVGSPPLRAMRRAGGDIPIVFAVVADPVEQGFVSSLAHPGGNITGFAGIEFNMATKQLELLKNLAPRLQRVALLYDPAQPAVSGFWNEIETAAPSLALKTSKAAVRTADETRETIAAIAREPNSGLLVSPGGPVTRLYREMIAVLALRHRLPAVYIFRYYVESGGLASYGPDYIDLCRRAASYVDRVLRGERPRDLPVQLPTKFELVLNLKTAKAMGLDLPVNVLALADHGVVEIDLDHDEQRARAVEAESWKIKARIAVSVAPAPPDTRRTMTR
jgi:putative ABC transport system substrate-binding protein